MADMEARGGGIAPDVAEDGTRPRGRPRHGRLKTSRYPNASPMNGAENDVSSANSYAQPRSRGFS